MVRKGKKGGRTGKEVSGLRKEKAWVGGRGNTSKVDQREGENQGVRGGEKENSGEGKGWRLLAELETDGRGAMGNWGPKLKKL